MLRTTLKSLAARRLRLLLTATAIILGVGFVTGTLVLTDTSTRLFDDQFARATAGVDLVVRDAATFGSGMGVEVDRDPVSDATLQTIREVPGVSAASGLVRGTALLVVDGEAVVPPGASAGLSWSRPPFNPFDIRRGRPPSEAGEIVVDHLTATAEDIAIGDPVTVSLEDGAHDFEVVGTAVFGEADGLPNATVALFAPSVAQHLYGLEGAWSEVQVVVDGATSDAVTERITDALGSGYDIQTNQDVASDSAAAAQEQLLFLRVMLLALAATSLVVGAFMIANTFAIVVAQRTREFATLRALGASSRQVLHAVLTEALAIATVASTIGVMVGIAAANGLKAVAGVAGIAIPEGPLAVEPTTLATGFGIGLLVTLMSAFVPARRASRTAPVAAMRAGDVSVHRVSRARLVVGAVGLLAGASALLAGAAAGQVGVVGVGALAATTAVTVLAPTFAGRAGHAIGALTGHRVVSRLARTNVRRAGRRTAATSMALALGLAVVTMMTVVASSAKTGIGQGVDDVIRAELIVQSARSEMLGGLSPHVHHHASEVPGVETAARMRFGHWEHGTSTRALTAIDPAAFQRVADLDIVAGDLDALDSGGIALAENVAETHDVTIGDVLPMRFSRTGDQQLRVVGIFDADDTFAVSTGYLISLETFAQQFAEDVDASVFLKLAPDADVAEVKADVEEALSDFPTAAVHDQAEAVAARTRMLDTLLGLVTVLLLLAVLIALLGITNALALSIVERTREVGLLRAVGMTRSQISRIVRLEAALTAAVGGVVGIVLGLVIAAALVEAMEGMLPVPLTVPAGQLASYLVVAALGGVLAGLLPGRRAAGMDVLDAIATS